jgi:hypothetical protein
MNVKGTVILTGKNAITTVYGEEQWKSFMIKLAQKDKYFSNVIMFVTLIPMDKFIFFLDELIKEFLNNDKSQYSLFGKVAANFGLSPGGPYHSYMLAKDIKKFAESVTPKIWSSYFDGGVVIARVENNIIHIKLTEFPFNDSYFESLVVAFFEHAIHLFGKKSIPKQIRSLTLGNNDFYYQYELIES